MVDVEEILSGLYHDWPICEKCGYPATKTDYHTFRYRKKYPVKYYECTVCKKKNLFHPGYNHDISENYYCVSKIRLNNLEKDYITWASNSDNQMGIHIITWPDKKVRFSSLLSYFIFLNSYVYKKSETPTIIMHFCPESALIDDDVLTDYEYAGGADSIPGIISSLELEPSTALGYLHICTLDKTIPSCPYEKQYSLSNERGGLIQRAKSVINFSMNLRNLRENTMINVITNSDFQFTGATLFTINNKISKWLNVPFKLIVIIDNISFYLSNSRMDGLIKFMQDCSNQGVYVIGFAPRSSMRFRLRELMSQLDFNCHSSTHTIDTKERIAFLNENEYFLTYSKYEIASPYSSYWEVVKNW